MTVSDVAGDNLDLVQSRNILQPAPEIERIILGERCYLRSGAEQMFDQVRTDETVGPGDKNAFALKIHLIELMKSRLRAGAKRIILPDPERLSPALFSLDDQQHPVNHVPSLDAIGFFNSLLVLLC